MRKSLLVYYFPYPKENFPYEEINNNKWKLFNKLTLFCIYIIENT